MNKKQTNAQNWKCWITSTMAWHWMTNLESWTKTLCIEVTKVWFYATILTSSNPVAIIIVCTDIKLSPTMLRKSFQRCCEENDKKRHWRCAQSVPENWQIWTTQNSALQCLYEQETDDSPNLEILDVMEVEVEQQC